MKRIDVLKQKAFKEKGYDGFLVTNDINALYFAGCPGLAAVLISRRGENTVYVYSVNYEQAKAEAKGFDVEMVKRGENLVEKIAKQTKNLQIKRLAADLTNFESYRKLAKMLRGVTKLKIQGNIVWEMRKIKDDEEVALMRKAGELTIEGMKAASETIKPSVKEYEVAAEIEYAMRRCGCWGTAFETIVASGTRSAFPHGGCTDKKIRNGDVVVVDIGAVYRYYRSDMTRTFVAGKSSERQKKIFNAVKLAQEKACGAVKPKAKAKDIDTVARKIIEDAGHAKYFVHGLGHGVGLEVHEPPTLNQESKDKLVIGNVVTIEPGIYIPGFGGFRVEDTVLVQKKGAEKFTDRFYSLKAKG